MNILVLFFNENLGYKLPDKVKVLNVACNPSSTSRLSDEPTGDCGRLHTWIGSKTPTDTRKSRFAWKAKAGNRITRKAIYLRSIVQLPTGQGCLGYVFRIDLLYTYQLILTCTTENTSLFLALCQFCGNYL